MDTEERTGYVGSKKWFRRVRPLVAMVVAVVLTTVGLPGSSPAGDKPQPAAEPALSEAGQSHFVFLNEYRFDPLLGLPAFPAGLAFSVTERKQNLYHVAQFRDRVTEEMKGALLATGARILGYVPSNGYLIAADAATIGRVHDLAAVRWVGPYEPAYKVSSRLNLAYDEAMNRAITAYYERAGLGSPKPIDTAKRIIVHVSTMERTRVAEVANALSRLGASDIGSSERGSGVIRAEVPRPALEGIAREQGVLWIEREMPVLPANDVARWIIQSDDELGRSAPIHDHGITGVGQSITVADTGVDRDHTAFRDLVNPVGPLHRKITDYFIPSAPCDGGDYYGLCGDDHDNLRCEEHGTHVAGSVAGDDGVLNVYDGIGDPNVPPSGSSLHDGQAFGAKIRVQDIMHPGGELTPPTDYGVLYSASIDPSRYPFSTAPDDFAWIHTNSWGTACVGGCGYTPDDQATDTFVWDHPQFSILFAAGNAGPAPGSLFAEAESKNIISVGASGVRSGRDDMYYPSSRGPTIDLRLKPDVLAPGGGIWSAMGCDGAAGSCPTPPDCAPNGYPDQYWNGDGTSMATPQVAGAAALVRQYFMEGWYPVGAPDSARRIVPSAALIKAVLINGAVEMNGAGTHNDTSHNYPNNDQGWGRILLDNSLYFSGDGRQLFALDESAGLGTNGAATYPFTVTDTSMPFEVTLAWTDYPGPIGGSGPKLVNDLDLSVNAPDGNVYHGNQYVASGPGESLANPGDQAWDRVNNVESVLVLAPTLGRWTITVSGYGVPLGPQPYALVVTGADIRIADPGFESGSFGVGKWNQMDLGCNFVSGGIVGTLGHTGTHSASIVGSHIGPQCGGVVQTLTGLSPARSYRLVGWYYPSNIGTGLKSLKISQNGSIICTVTSGPNNVWSQLPSTCTFTPVASTVDLQFYLRAPLSGTVTVNLDDIDIQ